MQLLQIKQRLRPLFSRRLRIPSLAILFILFAPFVTNNSEAAQYALVRSNQARVLAAPGGAPIETLTRGTRIVIANTPSGGYYKMRTPSGKIGVILERDIYIPPTAAAPQSATTQASGGTEIPGTKERPRLRLLGGGAFWTPTSALAVTLLASSTTLGYHFGAELNLFLGKSVFIPLRAEYLLKSLSADSGSATSSVTFTGLPIYTGIGVRFGGGEKVKFRLLALGGYAPIASLNATESFSGETWTTSASSGALTFGGLLGAEIRLGQSGKAALAIDAGYRYLVGGSVTPTTTSASPTTTLPDGTIVNRAQAVQVNLSGVMAELALVFRL